MKVALGFFGITRSLKYTIESIKYNIIDVFKSNDISYDIFIHTYFLNNYINLRASEKLDGNKIDNQEYNLLNPDFVIQDNQDEIKKKLNLESYRTNKDPWNSKYNCVDNFILGSYSKLMVTDMIDKNNKKSKVKYDYILFIRPDCLYVNKFNLDFFKFVSDDKILIPSFDNIGKYGINDRFAITNPSTYKIYGKVFLKLLELSKKYELHSETIIGLILNEEKIKTQKVKFNFFRIRCNGKTPDSLKFPQKLEPIKEKYELLCNTKSDINEHLPTLYKYATKCESILELGVRNCISSCAFVYGLLNNNKLKRKLFMNNINPCNLSNILKITENLNIHIKYQWINNLQLGVDGNYDLTFIDTWHVYGQLKRELNKFSKVTNKYIIMHDTFIDGELGETIRCGFDAEKQSIETGFPIDEINKGIMPAIEEFLELNKNWILAEKFTNNNGLTILEKKK